MNKFTEETILHLSFLARHFSEREVHSVVVVLLLELSVPSNYDGSHYLEQAVPLFWENPTQDMACVYEAIADRCGWCVDAIQIENAIRSAIKAAWECRDADVWKHYYLTVNRKDDRRPTNTEFISMLAKMLTLWKGCCRTQRAHEEVHV